MKAIWPIPSANNLAFPLAHQGNLIEASQMHARMHRASAFLTHHAADRWPPESARVHIRKSSRGYSRAIDVSTRVVTESKAMQRRITEREHDVKRACVHSLDAVGGYWWRWTMGWR